ncbi:MAG TPA: fused MFS/spermidine synthase [Candidatus Paceibacterota bacterium]|nr:fused MFS/spermidine synthase [Verrucomicrobiota bacterium]HRY49738.1 fused MFS/spermidine synthase [Candidatus Paceibacterota bacterium]
MMKSPQVVVATAVFCLWISGAAGLVYEVVWMRYLALFLGSTAYGIIAALVAFMGGLALGNAWIGRFADRIRRPLALYAWLEIGIGLYALVFPAYYEFCHQGFVRVAAGWEPGSRGLLVLKFGFSLLTIFFPTLLMGGTLPVLVKLVTRSLGELRERVSTLYFINSAGAVVGCCVADFWWIPVLGLQATVWAGAGLNLLVGAVGLVVSSWLQEGAVRSHARAEPVASLASEEETFTPSELRLAVVGIGLSGFVAMLYEVVWTRMLALALGSSTHAFSIMLITFISGIAVGAWIVGRWRRLRRTLDAFAWTELALAATLLLSMGFYDAIPYWFGQISGTLARRPEIFPLYGLAQALVCFLVMFVPTLFLGMTLPLVSRIATAELARTGRSVGAVFSVNTLGTVLGAAVTGLWLLPSLGLAGTLMLGISVNAAIGLAVLGRKLPRIRLLVWVGTPVGAAMFVMAASVIFADHWERVFTRALWRLEKPLAPSAYHALINGTRLNYYRDGAGATVSVESTQQGGVQHLTLAVNGKPDASTGNDVTTQRLLGHIPMLLRPESRQVLVVGLGSGMTCAAVLRHPTVEHLDAVEISPEVAEAARLFSEHNDQVLDHPKFHLAREDAKTFLQLTRRQYDVIVSEPSNPWMAGVAGVFSHEYYRSCRERLTPDGLMVQWVQIYETDDESFQVVLKTFGSVFPYFSVWMTAETDLALVGSTRPIRTDLQALRNRFVVPSVKSDLERIDLFRLPVFLSREIISQDNAPFVAPPEVAVHSDFYPVLEYLSQRAFFVRTGTSVPVTFDESFSPRPGTLLAQYLDKYPLTEDDYSAFGLFKLEQGMPDDRLYRSLLLRWMADYPQSTNAVELSAKAADFGLSDELEVQRLQSRRAMIWERSAADPEVLRYYGHFLMRSYAHLRSVFYRPPSAELEAVLQRLIEVDPLNQRVYRLHLAGLAWDRRDDAACFRFAREGLSPDTNAYGVANFELDRIAPKRIQARLIEAFWQAGKPREAWAVCQEALHQGYLDPTSDARDPLLDLTYRKVEAFIQSIPSQPAGHERLP